MSPEAHARSRIYALLVQAGWCLGGLAEFALSFALRIPASIQLTLKALKWIYQPSTQPNNFSYLTAAEPNVQLAEVRHQTNLLQSLNERVKNEISTG